MAPSTEEWCPFVFPDIWNPSFPSAADPVEDGILVRPIDLDLFIAKLDNPYIQSKSPDLLLHLPDLDNFEFGLPEQIVHPDESVSSVEESPPANPGSDFPDEFWIFPKFWEATGKANNACRSWETFSKPIYLESGSGLLSEAGAGAFDAALHLHAEQNVAPGISGNPIRTDALLESLWQLGLGRSSLLFPYLSNGPFFRQQIENSSATGCSVASSQSLFASILNGANAWIHLRNFLEETYHNHSTKATVVALASAISTIMSITETRLVAGGGTVRSMLQLHHEFEGPHKILGMLQDIVNVASSCRSDYEVIVRTFNKIKHFELASVDKNEIFVLILEAVSSPWLRTIEGMIGLRSGWYPELDRTEDLQELLEQLFEVVPGTGEVDLDGLEQSEIGDFAVDFITEQEKDTIRETSKWFRYLEDHNPSHPFLHLKSDKIHCSNLKLAFNLEDVQRIWQEAQIYEERLVQAAESFNPDIESTVVSALKRAPYDPRQLLELYGLNDEQISRNIEKSMAILDAVPSQVAQESIAPPTWEPTEPPRQAEREYWTEISSSFGVPISLVPSLSLMPIINAQSHLINFASLQTLFQRCNLREHLRLNYAFHLFGSGTFVSRLSSILFDQNMATAERQRGIMRSSISLGLRLGSGSRKTWPPASSELRLTLMGVLADSWRNGGSRSQEMDQLLGHLSFGIRELPDDEIERCLDVDSIYALDFLRLQYKGPAALQEVMTDSCLEKYDRAFRFFVKLLRMTFTVNQLCSRATSISRKHDLIEKSRKEAYHARRFRLEAFHLVSTLSTHFFNSAVSVPWRRLQDQLDAIEQTLNCSPPRKTAIVTVCELQAMHSETLDGILAGLMLRQRQHEAAKILEDIFGDILSLYRLQGLSHARILNLDKEAAKTEEHDTSILYESFQKKVHEFIRVCGKLGEREMNHARSRTIAKDDASRSALQLVELLTLSGYYSRVDVRPDE